MATKIEWTDETWNPIRGCSRVSEGCRNCYAEKVAYRFSDAGLPYHGLVGIGGKWNGNIKFVEEHLLDPLKWKKPRRIFVNSMSDLFHENVTDEMRDRIFAVMALCPQHTFQVLTKRPERMLAYLSGRDVQDRWGAVGGPFTVAAAIPLDNYAARVMFRDDEGVFRSVFSRWPLPNVWLGVSVEDQKTADERIPLLLQTPAAVRFISAEPLLGPITFRWRGWDDHSPNSRRAVQMPDVHRDGKTLAGCVDEYDGLRMLDWVIVGGESGPGARPMHPDWARSLRDQCVAAGVPFFFKQWGEWKPICNMPEDEYNALYVSNKKAPELWQQDECDDLHGRRCTVPVAYLGYGGAPGLIDAYQSVDGHGGMMFFRIGKKAAGHLLDGKEYHQFPAVTA